MYNMYKMYNNIFMIVEGGFYPRRVTWLFLQKVCTDFTDIHSTTVIYHTYVSFFPFHRFPNKNPL